MKTTPATKNKTPIPLGYEQCEMDVADRFDRSWRLNLAMLFNTPAGDSDHWSVYIRSILPADIKAHWEPAPGITHEEQWAHGHPMGDGAVAVYAPGILRVQSSAPTPDHPGIVPLVPKVKSFKKR